MKILHHYLIHIIILKAIKAFCVSSGLYFICKPTTVFQLKSIFPRKTSIKKKAEIQSSICKKQEKVYVLDPCCGTLASHWTMNL